MSDYLQNILAAVACLVAAIYISLRAWKVMTKRGSAGCGSQCGSCTNSQGESGMKIKSLISLELPMDAKETVLTSSKQP